MFGIKGYVEKTVPFSVLQNAIIISVVMPIIKGNGIFGWMIAGGILCAVFAGLLFTEYYSIH